MEWVAVIVALYARVSTDKQNTDNQMLRLREVASARSYEVYDEYVDVSSGANAKRPALDRMRADAKVHRFDKILCIKIDRLARSIVNLTNLMTDLDTWGIGVEFLDQPIDTSTPSGKLTLTILGALAEFERELIHDRTMAGLERAKSQGKKSGRAPVKLSPYQIAKARQIVEENPGISNKSLAAHFTGISRNTLIKLLRQEKVIQ